MMQTSLTATPKVALVTGGAQRIGKAIVEDLAAHGFTLAIHCNGSRDTADRLAADLAGNGANCAVVEADLTDRGDVAGLIEDAERRLGPISLLVNNASIFEDDGATDFEWGAWDRHFAIHLEAPAMLARVMAERLPHGRDGLVVNLIDQRVWRPTPKFFSYTLSKSALWTATRTLAQALAPTVRVNAIGPGPTLPNERQDDGDFQRQIDALLLRRGPDLAEFGRTIRWLWETRSVTGQMIALDGGQHLAWETPDVAGVAE
jgi:NAD(P)-dependent dehydrogenase (short-subunit alcohol dehydrogenase family)